MLPTRAQLSSRFARRRELNERDILQTFAQVGVAITGFTGVVFILGNRARGEWSIVENQWLRVLLETSLCVVVFSLFPVVLDSVLASATVWRISAGLLGIAAAGIYIAALFRFVPHVGLYPRWWRLSAYTTMLLLGVLIVACELVAAGKLSGLQPFVYLFTLGTLVGMALGNFAFLVVSSRTERPPAA